MPDSVRSRLNDAESGKVYWQAHGLDEYDIVLLINQKDNHLDEMLISALRTTLHRLALKKGGNYPQVVVLSTSPIGKCEYFASLLLSEELADSILGLYSLYAFTDKLIIGSFDLPHGRKLRNLLDSGIAAKEELIYDVILGGNFGHSSQI